MRDGWVETNLAQVASEFRGRTKVMPGTVYPAAGVMMEGRGLLDRGPFIGGKTTYKNLTQIKGGQLVLRSITAWEAPIAVVSAEFSGRFVSGVFPVFDLDAKRILPAFMELVCTNPTFWSEMRERCVGSVLRRKVLGAKALLEISINLPPLMEQRRIVDVVESVDNYIAALQEGVDAARTARKAIAEEVFNSDFPTADLLSLGRIVTGSTPSTKKVEFWEPEAIDFLSPGDFGRELHIQQTSRKLSKSGALAARLLKSCSVVQVCIGATIGKVGYVEHELVTNQQVNAIEGLSLDDAYFAALMLSTGKMQAEVKDRAGQTTLPIISKSRWSALEIPWPDEVSRKAIADTAKSVDAFVRQTEETLSHARNLRSAMLSDLLSGEHEIPKSYDKLLGAA